MGTTRLGASVLVLSCFVSGGCSGANQTLNWLLTPPQQCAAAPAQMARTTGAEVGQPAPDLAIHSLNGKGDVRLHDLHGKVVLVDFWATWCAPCKKSFPALEAVASKYPGRVQVVGVNVNDESSGIVDFAKQAGTTFPVGWDDRHSIAERWSVPTMPSTYIVDEAGTVRFVHVGYHDGEEDEMGKEIASLLGDTLAVSPQQQQEMRPDEAVAETQSPKPTTHKAQKAKSKRNSKKKLVRH
jgi:thiol-disulfide isomerase/thioredoxin